MTTNIDRAQLVSRKVQLEAVGLQAATVHATNDLLSPPPELELSQGYRARYDLRDEYPGHVHVLVDLRFSGETGSGVALVTLEATYCLVYRVSDAGSYPADALQHFAELNGIYNIWPYWRELVQTVSGRIGISSIVIPVFRPAVRELTEGEEEQLQMQLGSPKNTDVGSTA